MLHFEPRYFNMLFIGSSTPFQQIFSPAPAFTIFNPHIFFLTPVPLHAIIPLSLKERND